VIPCPVQRTEPVSLPPVVLACSRAGNTCHDKSGRPQKFQGGDSAGRNVGAYLAMNLNGHDMIVPLGRPLLRNEPVQQVPANVSGTLRGPRDFSLLRDCLIPDLLLAMVRCPGTKDR
jgi:hypothetical protein